MTSPALQPLSLGRSSFERLRAQNCIYVDKTALICQLCQTEDKALLCRPRRFGKSLLLSAIDSLFRNGLRDFKGLAIEKLWTDKTYSVARLDFSGIRSIHSLEEFRTSFRSSIAASFAPLGFVFDPNDTVILFIDQLKIWLNRQPVNSLVILIDEYDAPLTDLLENPPLFESVRGDLGNFFAALKQCDSCMRFLFITGITKYGSASISAGLNAFTDISLDPAYGTLLGLTEEEIKTYFSEYLDRAASVLRTTAEDVLSSLQRNYDGFSFDQQASARVYCPWSVLNFLKDPDLGFKDYWFSSGGQPSLLMKLFEHRELDAPESYAADRFVRLEDLEASREDAEMDPNVLLAQAGYLTIKAVDDDGIVRLGYPNQEVAYAMARLFARKLTPGQQLSRGGEPGLRSYSPVKKSDSPSF